MSNPQNEADLENLARGFSRFDPVPGQGDPSYGPRAFPRHAGTELGSPRSEHRKDAHGEESGRQGRSEQRDGFELPLPDATEELRSTGSVEEQRTASIPGSK